MSAEPASLGYLLYLASVLLPGYGLGELFGRWTKYDGVMQRIGLSLGYGIAFDTVVFAVATLGYRVGPIAFAGVEPALVYFIIGFGAVLLSVSILRKKGLDRPPKLSVGDLAVVACSGTVLAIILLYFQKYPIFPTFYNPDYVAIVKQPARLIDGTLVTIPQMLLYGAGTYQMAAAFLLVGATDLATAQHSMAMLAVLSPFLVYAVACRLFGGRRAPLAATIVYSLSGTIWAQMIYSDGLYPNFVGVLLQLTLVVAFLDLSANLKRRSAWVASGVVLIASYFSHYTVLAILGTFVVLAGVQFLMARKGPDWRPTLTSGLVFLAPAAVGAVLFRSTFLTDLKISYQSGGSQPLTTPLSSLLSSIPSVAYLAFDIRNDLGFVATVILLAAAMYKGAKFRAAAVALPAVWFFGLLVAAPQDYAAWRFSLEALVPLTLLAGYGLDALMPKRKLSKAMRLKRSDPYVFMTVVVGLLFLTPIVATGWASTFTQTLVPGAAAQAQSQNQDLMAMTWLGQNTKPSSTVLSITDPTFLYTGLFAGRNCSYGYTSNETQAIAVGRQDGFSYLVITRLNVYFNVATPAPNDSATYLPWFTFSQSSNAKLVYGNAYVRIYQINAT